MTPAMSPWLEWPLIAATIGIGWSALNSAAHALIRLKPRARAATSSPPPGPGPGRPPRHATGPVTHTIRTWACGCVHTWDGTGRLTNVLACRPPRTLDDELKDLTR